MFMCCGVQGDLPIGLCLDIRQGKRKRQGPRRLHAPARRTCQHAWLSFLPLCDVRYGTTSYAALVADLCANSSATLDDAPGCLVE